MDFKGKNIAIIGDSITSHGGYLLQLRQLMNGYSTGFYNLGIAGSRMDVAEKYATILLKQYDNVDYCIISFGDNDLGIWLYDDLKPETEELLKKRQDRIDIYANSLNNLISIIKNMGITPIVLAPFTVDGDIEPKNDVDTNSDNKEKETYIGNNFYTKETFRKINLGLKVMRDECEKISKKNDVIFWDIFTPLIEKADHSCFNPDGCHYSQKGNELVAQLLFDFIAGEKISDGDSNVPQKLFELEEITTTINFVIYNALREFAFSMDKDQLYKKAIEIFDKEKILTKNMSDLFIDNYYNQQTIIKKILSLVDRSKA